MKLLVMLLTLSLYGATFPQSAQASPITPFTAAYTAVIAESYTAWEVNHHYLIQQAGAMLQSGDNQGLQSLLMIDTTLATTLGHTVHNWPGYTAFEKKVDADILRVVSITEHLDLAIETHNYPMGKAYAPQWAKADAVASADIALLLKSI